MERASVCESSTSLIVAACANFADFFYSLSSVNLLGAGSYAQDKEPAGTRQSGTTALTRAAQVMSTCIVCRSTELGAASLPRRVIYLLHNLVSLLMYIGAGSLHQEGMVELGGRSRS